MKQWLQAFRLRTLPLAVSSIIVGSALAAHSDHGSCTPRFNAAVLLLALLTAVLLQILSNLANDLGDHEHGTDNAERVGPQRTVQSGAITPDRMKRAMLICGVLAFLSGFSLITVAMGFSATTLVFLFIGLAAMGAAVKYTFGSNPYGYAGLGDISVFIFFGIVGVCGTFYLHSGAFHPVLMLPAIAFGLLSTGVLNVNNMRDIHNDAARGKRTLVVRMGAHYAKVYHTILVLGGVVALSVFAWMVHQWQAWLFMLVLPGFIIHLKRVWTAPEPRALDPQLKVLAMDTFLTALLFSLGLILAV